jgi:hypothetical protein
MQFSQDHPREKKHEPLPKPAGEQKLREATERITIERPNSEQKKQLESGVFRRKIYAGYIDALNAGMPLDQCIREGIAEGAKTLLDNRSVQLKGLDSRILAAKVWKIIEPQLGQLNQIPSELRRHHVVAAVTRSLVLVAFRFCMPRSEARWSE